MKRPFVDANRAERVRLRELAGSISDQELNLPLPNGWPVYVALAHMAFWDQRSAILLRTWATDGIAASPIDPHVVNDALLPFLKAIPARQAADLATAAAEAVDTELENAPDELIAGISALGDRFRLYRSDHRGLHLNQIHEALRKR
jgi:hypothetical protein